MHGKELRVRAWAVRDSGLAVVGPRHRRLPGALRHHRGSGAPWPAEVTLVVTDGALEVPGVGRWSTAEVSATAVRTGPPLTFVLRTPVGDHLLAVSATEVGRRLVAALSGEAPPAR